MSAEPTQAVRTERSQKRVRAYLGGDLVADTSAPLLVWENTSYPAYYIPAADIRADLIPAGQSAKGEPDIQADCRRHSSTAL